MESELAELNANLSRLQLNFLPKSDFITDDSIDPTDQEIEVEPPLPFSYPDTSTSNQEDIIELEELFRSRLNSSPQPIKITTTTSSSSEEPSMPATTAVIKHNLTQPSFKLRYASDCTLSFTLCSPLTPLGLKNIFIQHQTLKFAYFQAGIISDQVCFDFHGSLCLPFLKKITFQIPASPSDHTETGLPHDFKRLLHLLQLITYGRLECLRFDCDPLTAIRIPLISAFLPSYEPEDSHPLSDLILKNRDTLHSIVIGPTLQEMVIRTNPAPCPGVCEPANYPKIESFTYFPDVPILPSLSPILRVQKHLTKLIVTLSHIDVWYDVCHAIRSSCNNLESFGFNLVSLDEEAAIVDLKILRVCEKLKELSIQFEGCNVIGWGFIPRTVTTLNFLGGQLTNANTELMSLALPNLEDVNMFLAKPAHQKSSNTLPSDNLDVSRGSGLDPVIIDIIHHPAFHFVKAAPRSLKSFNVECDVGVELNWEDLRKTCAFQREFRLVERSELGNFSLEREMENDDQTQEGVQTNQGEKRGSGGEEQNLRASSLFSSCLGALGL